MAVVGCGAISHWHLDAMERSTPPIDIVAAVDPVADNARRIGERTGAAIYSSLDAAIDAGGFDAALIAVPHHLHEVTATRVPYRVPPKPIFWRPKADDIKHMNRSSCGGRARGSVSPGYRNNGPT